MRRSTRASSAGFSRSTSPTEREQNTELQSAHRERAALEIMTVPGPGLD